MTGISAWTLAFAILFSFHSFIFLCESEELAKIIGKLNKEGFPGSLLLDAAKEADGGHGEGKGEVSDENIIKTLESDSVQKLAISKALNYAGKQMSEDVKKESVSKLRSSWREYCSYGWLRWLSFMNCEEEQTSSDVNTNQVGDNDFNSVSDEGRTCSQTINKK